MKFKDYTRHLKAVAADVTPRLEAKLAAPDDPMYDHVIDVRILANWMICDYSFVSC